MDKQTEHKLVTAVNSALKDLEYDVTQRNTEINLREKYLFGNGLFSQINFDAGQWFAEYNYLKRVVNIHSSQLMGRGFNIYSYYDKEDLSPYEGDDNQLQLAELNNKKAKANADGRKKAVEAIIRDNGGYAKFKDGARLGSAFGVTIYKMWFDKKKKKINISLLESPQNYRAGWTDGDFRERDWDAYVWQISEDKAYREYGSVLQTGESFEVSKYNEPFTLIPDDSRKPQTDRKFVTVVELTGYLQGWSGEAEVPRGSEKPMSVLVVGGHVAETETNPDFLPKYYIINNRQDPRRAWGSSDLPQSALDINQEIVQLEADTMTWANKSLFKKFQAKGFTADSIPKWKPRKTQMVAMAPEQSIDEVNMSLGELQQFRQLIESKLEAFVRVTEVGRVLFDDPTINANSNQALMTTLKGVIDIVEDKQTRWEPVIREMFTDALYLSAKFIPELKDLVITDENWFLCIEWPSVLRREDATYQTMWLNLFNAGVISLETYQEKIGLYDTGEEMDRIRDEMKDPISAAVMGHQLGEVAHQTINKSLGIPPWGYVIPHVQLRGELAPQETGNMAHNYGWDQGPYGPAIGPTGMDGQISADNFLNSGFLNGNPRDGGGANYQGPQQQPQAPAPQITPDQNQVQPVSQPGSGATPTSAQGAVNKTNQNAGK